MQNTVAEWAEGVVARYGRETLGIEDGVSVSWDALAAYSRQSDLHFL